LKYQISGMKYGYARISTIDQNADMQLKALQRAGCKKIFTDRRTGATQAPCPHPLPQNFEGRRHAHRLETRPPRPQLARPHPHGRDFDERGIQFRSLTEKINTATPRGKLIFHIFGALAEFERGLIIERTREGIKAARARGIKSGPPPKLNRQQIDHARQLIEQEGKRREDVAGLFKVSRSTLYRALA
jgi:DNA invertase Pin-like site-specific DNA recombinase